MSQDKPVLGREQVEALHGSIMNRYLTSTANVYPQTVADLIAYRDLALSALERQGSGKWVPVEKGEGSYGAIRSNPGEKWHFWMIYGKWGEERHFECTVTLPPMPQTQDAQTGEGKS